MADGAHWRVDHIHVYLFTDLCVFVEPASTFPVINYSRRARNDYEYFGRGNGRPLPGGHNCFNYETPLLRLAVSLSGSSSGCVSGRISAKDVSIIRLIVKSDASSAQLGSKSFEIFHPRIAHDGDNGRVGTQLFG